MALTFVTPWLRSKNQMTKFIDHNQWVEKKHMRYKQQNYF